MKNIFNYITFLCILGVMRCQDGPIQTQSEVADVQKTSEPKGSLETVANPAVSEVEPAKESAQQNAQEQSSAVAEEVYAGQLKAATELYHDTIQQYDSITKEEVSSKTFQMLSEALEKTWLLSNYMKFPKTHNLNDPTLFAVIPYLAKVCTSNLLPYYATQPFCVKMKSYYEPVDIDFYTTVDASLAKTVQHFEEISNLKGFVFDEQSQELMLTGLGTSLKNLFGYLKEIDIKKVSAKIAKEKNLDVVLVERFVSFVPITLYAIASVLTNELKPDMIAEAVCTHMGYSVYVDNKLSPISTGQNFWKQVKAFKALSGTTASSAVMLLALGLGSYALL